MNGPQFRTRRRRVQNILDCGSLNPNYFYTSRPRPAPYNLISHETENEILWGLGLAAKLFLAWLFTLCTKIQPCWARNILVPVLQILKIKTIFEIGVVEVLKIILTLRGHAPLHKSHL